MRASKKILIALAALLTAIAATAQPGTQDHVRFAWGAGFQGSVDMSGHDMSSIGIDAYFGMSTPGIQILGAGVGICEPVSNSFHSMPIYLIARSSFSVKPQLCFADLRCGVSVNDVEANTTQTGEYVSVGAGINLASSSKFISHLILAYTFIGRRDFTANEIDYHLPDLQMVTIRVGITF
ncbi:MAG: hypothetical protein LIP03_09605 [Bacteroidales bacterium]|nr:hypothetical protein [Bacteroidales bacterium]